MNRDRLRGANRHQVLGAARLLDETNRLLADMEFVPRTNDKLARVRRAPIRERDVERYLVKRAKAMGGEVRKVTWQGRRFAPDRIVMLPRVTDVFGDAVDANTTIWVELKAPGEKPTSGQLREHTRMRALGQHVEVVDSFARVDEVLS